MIISAGLTPAWQTVMRLGRLTAGEVNRAIEVHHFASGKVLNVAIALSHWDVPCKAISIGGGATRELLDRDLSGLGISRHWIVCDSETRSCVTLLDEASGLTTELVENANRVTLEKLDEFAAVFRHDSEHAAAVVLTGSLPPGTPESYYRQLMSAVDCPVILDARGPELLQALECRPWLVKPNRAELAATVGRQLKSEDEVLSAMRELVARGAQHVLVSNGPDPAWFLDGRMAYRILPPRIKRPVNPIGSGDCLAAGAVTALAEGRQALDCVVYGMAAAAENAQHLLTGRFARSCLDNRQAEVQVLLVT